MAKFVPEPIEPVLTAQQRKLLLDRISAGPARSTRAAGDNGLNFDEFVSVAECLCMAPMPLRAATEGVTERYALGPRGTLVMGLISRGIHYPAEISLVLGVGRSLMTAEVNRLVDSGLVERQVEAGDRRRARLTLTVAGSRAHGEVRDQMVRIVKSSLAGYSNSQVRNFARMLETMRSSDTAAT